MYGMAQSIPDRSIVNEFAYAFLHECYNTEPETANSGAGDRYELPRGCVVGRY